MGLLAFCGMAEACMDFAGMGNLPALLLLSACRQPARVFGSLEVKCSGLFLDGCALGS